MCIIRLDNVSFSYHGEEKEVLKKINLSFLQKEITAIIGPNGCGKTTLTKLIMSILKPTKGEIFINNLPIKTMTLAEVGRKIAYIFQNPEKQLFCATVGEEMAFGLAESNLTRVEKGEIISFYLNYFQLEAYRKVFPLFLSQGEKQRLVIAAAAALNPDFFLMDEPTTGLDAKRKELLGVYLEKMAALGKGIIIVSHDRDFVGKYGDRVIAIGRDGCVAENAKVLS